MVPCAPLRQYLRIPCSSVNCQSTLVCPTSKCSKFQSVFIRFTKFLTTKSERKMSFPFAVLLKHLLLSYIFISALFSTWKLKKGLVCKIVHNFQEKSERNIWTYRLPIDFSIRFFHKSTRFLSRMLRSDNWIVNQSPCKW